MRLLAIAGVVASCAAVASIGACLYNVPDVDSVPDVDGSDATSDVTAPSNDGAPGVDSAAPPPLPADASATTSTAENNFAIQALLLGDTARGSSTQSSTAWKDYGYNLDGKISTASSTDVCTPAAGAQKSLVYTDGTNGIDNSFGENILPLFNGFSSNLTANNNEAIQAGKLSIEIDVKGLTSDPAQTSSGLGGYLNPAGPFDPDGGTPTFTTADNWPVLSTLLTNPTDPSSSTVSFPRAYVVGGTWVSAPFGSSSSDLPITIVVSSSSFSFTIHKAIITFDHTASTKADNGTIAGVINTEELVADLKTTVGRLSPSFCTGSAFDSIATQIMAASDILSDGTNQPDVRCDSISIGIGFTAVQIAPQSTVVAPATLADPCAEAD